ncbi:THAP domain-containing protein 1-like [Oopsacas minuta]|uniref:THAP domain-containing protein 1-like n=1 Tax=Oopsacas minuta TaxID=111878 RepID=A0AAV7JBE0_9METZ|nr:THAP domain-containing protein 1-like [Oopsacas minuta]
MRGVGCRVGYSGGRRKHLFQFPNKFSLQERWIEFLNRINYSSTSNSTICIDHFEGKYIVQHSNRPQLNYLPDPIPSIHPLSIPKSQRVIPHKHRKPPVQSIYKDELPSFKAKFKFDTLQDISLFLTTSNETKN